MKIKGFKTLDEFIIESKKNNKEICVSFGGKFQPFHFQHFKRFEYLVKKFGEENVFITTTDVDPSKFGEKHFMTFEEKKLIMTKMFNIPNNKIIKVKNNYAPKELTGMFPETTAFITTLGKKDADRLTKGGKYYIKYDEDIKLKGYMEKGYVYVIESGGISASEIREFFRSDASDDEKKKYFKKLYGKFNAQVFNLFMQRLSLNESLHIHYDFYNERLNCGGAFGHLQHIYDDITLSFNDLRELVTKALEGKLENAVEKSDGVALAISWKNGKLISARNKSQYKNHGENALGYSALKDFFKDRGEIGDAYNLAIEDLQSSLMKLPKKELDEIFKDGKVFMHLEVIYVPTENTIPYGTNLLVFHNVTEYDFDGNPISENKKDSEKLAKLIKEINEDIQKTFKIQGSPYIDMKTLSDIDKKKTKFLKEINKIQSKHNLNNNNTLLDYYIKEWETFLRKEKPELNDIILNGLITRWAKEDKKGFMLTNKNITDPEIQSWAKEFEKKDLKNVSLKIKRPIELLFVGVAIEVMRNFKTFLAANPDEATKKMKDNLEAAIKQIKTEDDESALVKMTQWLERLEAAGGAEAIFPSEGIVFEFKGKMYKLTGTFTDIHQIVSIIKFK